jgi:RNA polymerase sigma-70 factor (ECF subfamily)
MEEFDLKRFKRGDENVFKQIVDQYSERLFNTVIRIVQNVDDAEEIVQEALVISFIKRKGFRGEASIYTWLVRIAYNLALNHLKKKRPTVDLDPRIPTSSNPEKDIERKEIGQRIEKALTALPPRQRTVFSLRFYDNLPYKSIARILKCKEGTAKALYHFAVEKLSNSLKDVYHIKESTV